MFSVGTNRSRWRTTALLAVSASLLFACSGDSESPLSSVQPSQPATEEPAPEEPAPEEPAPEEPAPEEPAPEEPAPEEPAPEPAPEAPADEPLTTEEWAVVILLGLLALAAIAGIAAFLSRGQKGQSSGVVPRQARLDEVTRICRSVHDSSVMSVLQTTDPAALRTGWPATQHQLIDLEGRISYLAADLSDATNLRAVQELGTAVTAVRGALESNVGLRLDESGVDQTDLIEASNRTVLQRNEQLEAATQGVSYLRL